MKQKVQVWIYFLAPHAPTPQFLIFKTRPGRGEFWQPVTGGVEEGEPLETAALREAQEETGLSFSNTPDLLGPHFEFESRGHRIHEYGFSLRVDETKQPPQIRLDPNEHTEYKWVSAEEAIQMIKYSSNIQMLNLLQRDLENS